MKFPSTQTVRPTGHPSLLDNPYLTLTYAEHYWCGECGHGGHKVDFVYRPRPSHPLDRETAYQAAGLL